MTDFALKYIRNLIQLIFSPGHGWEDLGRDVAQSKNPVAGGEFVYRYCFLPAIGVCACSSFIRLLYDDTLGFWGAFQMAVITFISLFIAAEFSKYILHMYLPRLTCNGDAMDRNALELIMYSLTFLGMISLVTNVIKVRIALIEFLPLYVIFVIWKGWKFMNIEERNIGLYVILATFSILGSAYLVAFLLNALI